ncbi:phage tail assembly protein [Shewanella frigidimarina]|uniref:phage tail assembly protein n=1 Tax=Shewanella frigidimarina TaxID=56812 RepID=UPI003D7A157D
MFEPKSHNLVWPIEDDKKQPLTSVPVKLLTMGQHREMSKAHKGKETDLLRACICASTGLTLSEVKCLVTPDYTSLQEQVLDLMHISAAQLIEGFDTSAEPVLLAPFQGDDGQDKTGYTLRPPTVATTDLMDTHKDEWERTLFISSSCSGFSREELERFSLPDWNLLQERLIDFLEKSADFFRQKTLKS